MVEPTERIAVLEAEVDILKDNHKELLKCMYEIKDEMTRYKGFLGGIAFLTSGVVVFITVFKDWLIKHI